MLKEARADGPPGGLMSLAGDVDRLLDQPCLAFGLHHPHTRQRGTYIGDCYLLVDRLEKFFGIGGRQVAVAGRVRQQGVDGLLGL